MHNIERMKNCTVLSRKLIAAFAGIFEASNTIRGTSDEKTLGVKHMKAALQMEELLTGNGHPDFRLTA